MTDDVDRNRANYAHLADRASTYRLRVQSYQVQPGSEMDVDDRYLEPVKRSFQEHVWQFLGSAADHLRLIGESGRVQPATNPFAFATLARSAITTTATALWFLDGDQPTRRTRILEIIANDFASYAKYRATVEPVFTAPEEQRKFSDEGQVLADRTDWIVAEYNSLTGANFQGLNGIGSQVSDTTMVRAAGSFLDPSWFTRGLGPDAELFALWQQLSGYAHGRPWAYQSAKTTASPADANGLAPTTISGDPELIITSAAAAMTLIEIAFDKADRLSLAPVSP